MRTFTAIASLFALASGALGQGGVQGCYEAIRYGQTTISPAYPKAVKPGDVSLSSQVISKITLNIDETSSGSLDHHELYVHGAISPRQARQR
jgi:hypothetical protein